MDGFKTNIRIKLGSGGTSTQVVKSYWALIKQEHQIVSISPFWDQMICGFLMFIFVNEISFYTEPAKQVGIDFVENVYFYHILVQTVSLHCVSGAN